MGMRNYDATKDWEVISEEEISVGATAVGFTASLLVTSDGKLMDIANVMVTTGSVRSRVTADPTASVGDSFQTYDTFQVNGPNDLRKIRFISESGTSKIFVQYGRK